MDRWSTKNLVDHVAKSFGCQEVLLPKNLIKNWEIFLFTRQVVFYLSFWAHAVWIVYQWHLIDQTTKIGCFDFLPKTFGFFSVEVWRNLVWFFANFLTFSRNFLQTTLSPKLGRESVQLFARPRCTTKRIFVHKKVPKIFSQHGFFCRNILDFSNLPTAFINFNTLLLVAHCTNEILPCFLSSGLQLKLTIPEKFGCRSILATEKLAKKTEENCFSRDNLVHFSNFLGSYWLKSLLKLSNQGKIKKQSIWFFAQTLWLFFGWVLVKIFCVFSQILGCHQEIKFSFKRLCLRA